MYNSKILAPKISTNFMTSSRDRLAINRVINKVNPIIRIIGFTAMMLPLVYIIPCIYYEAPLRFVKITMICESVAMLMAIVDCLKKPSKIR